MANYIQLIDKTTNKPEPFQKVDELLCAAMNQPCDDNKYLCGWYDTIGWRSVEGTTLESIAADLVNEGYETTAACIAWIDERYTLKQWYGA